MIISGNKIAKAIQIELQSDMVNPVSLHIFIVGKDPVIESFVNKKRQFAENLGVEFIEHRFVTTITQEELMTSIKESAATARGIVIQLPLPAHMNAQEVLDTVPAELDVDGLGTHTAFMAPVAGAVVEILTRKNIDVTNKKALVIGKGRLVGEPVAKLLTELGAQVTVVDKATDTASLADICKVSDIIVSGAGVPNLVQAHMVKDGCVLLDAGTSTQSGSVVGDISLACADVAKYFSRTPGGIGPITVAVLFKNFIHGPLMTK